MEIDQPTSKFQKNPLTKIIPTLNAFEGANNLSSHFKNESTKLDKYFSQIISRGYQVLDSFSGYSSHFLFKFLDDYNFPHLYDILQLLKDNNFLKQYIFGDLRYNDVPFFYRLDLFPAYDKVVTDARPHDKAIGHGFGKNAEEVFSKAIGEFLERYFLTIYHKKDLLRGSAKLLRKSGYSAPNLNLLAGFSDRQKEFNPRMRFDDESIFCWEKTKRWSTGETVYLPAQLVHWTYSRDESEPFLCESNTNAAGGFFTLEGAILSGIYESIQRDSFFIYWLNQLTPKRIDPKTVPHDGFQTLLNESERYGFEIHCLNIAVDTGIPAFAVVISDPSGAGPRFCLGGGCQADPAKALHRALEEAWSVYYWMRPRPSFPALDKNYRPFSERIGQDERLRLWANPEMGEHLNFLISGKEERFSDINFDYPGNFASQDEELKFLVKKIENLGPGYEVFYYEARHPLLSSLGYHSAQIIVPQLFPLYLGEINAPLGSSRIKDVPRKLGLAQVAKFNPLPHLFP